MLHRWVSVTTPTHQDWHKNNRTSETKPGAVWRVHVSTGSDRVSVQTWSTSAPQPNDGPSVSEVALIANISQSVNSLLSQCHPQTSCSNYTNWRGQHHFTLTTTVHYWKSAFITERNPTLDVDDIILVISHRFRIILFVKLCCKHWVARLPTKVAPCGVTNPRLENTVMILYDDPVE